MSVLTNIKKSQNHGLHLDSHNDAHLICSMHFLTNDIIDEVLLFCKSVTESAKAFLSFLHRSW